MSKYSELPKQKLIQEYYFTTRDVVTAYHTKNIHSCCRINKKLYLQKRLIKTLLEEKYDFRIEQR